MGEERNGLRVTAAALGQRESAQLFGVPLANSGIQPTWLEIENQRDHHYLFLQHNLDPDYFPAGEAAYKSRYSPGKRVLSYGIASLILFPLPALSPLRHENL